MSKPTNAAAIGAFVVGAFLILFAMLFLLSGDMFNRNIDRGLVVFDGSIKGLNVGAPVAFKGVPIGEVSGFDVVVDSDTYEVLTPVLLRIDRTRVRSTDEDDDEESAVATNILVQRGLRAQLQLQSLLTGLLYVQLDFYPGSEERYNAEMLRSRYDIDEDVIIVPTVPTDLERLTQGLQELDLAELARDVSDLLDGIHKIVNDENTQALPQQVSATLLAIEDLSRNLDSELAALSPDVSQLLASTSETMETLNQDIPALSADADQALQDLSRTLETAQQALNNMEYLLSDDSAVLHDLRKAANEMSAAGRSLQSLAETLETQPEALIRGKRQ